MRRVLFHLLPLLAAVAAPHVVAAQEPGIQTGVSLVPGAVFDSTDAGPSIGGAVTVDVSRWMAFEGAMTYVNRGDGIDAFNIQAGILGNLANVNGRMTPFITGGVGIYRASGVRWFPTPQVVIRPEFRGLHHGQSGSRDRAGDQERRAGADTTGRQRVPALVGAGPDAVNHLR